MDRRSFLRRGLTSAGLAGVAGCTTRYASDDSSDADPAAADDSTGATDSAAEDGPADETEAVPEVLRVEDPPEAVYVPTHRETMRLLEPVDAGDYRLAPMLSYPHPFWLVNGRETTLVEPEASAGVHLMFTLWDAGTGTVVPVESGASIELERAGEPIGPPVSPWPMLSQEMGFHFGDNVRLEEDGTYAVTVGLPRIGIRKTGALEGRFDEFETVTFEFTYDDEFRREVVDVDYLDEELWGRRGALEPMEMAMGHGGGGEQDHDERSRLPYSALPEPESYPGTHLFAPSENDDSDVDGDENETDYPKSGDAVFVSTLLEPGSRFVGSEAESGDEDAADARYLLVSPRTPYNRVPLADMVLTATLEREGTIVAETDLEQTLDGELGLHYGAPLTDVESGDALTIAIEGVPQVARHQGYETAFLDMPSIELEVMW